MEYVHVESGLQSRSGIDYSRASVRQSSRALVSLIEALGKKNFGFDSTLRLAQRIRDYKNRLQLENLKIYADSGGYSIIKGDVPFDKTTSFINCYNRYLEYEQDSFDFIFSLDIPIWGREEDSQHLTRKNLFYFNDKSTKDSLDIISKHPELANKWFFVWHFKFSSQFTVWSDIFANHQVSHVTSNYAIGGQVGLRKMAESARGRALDFTVFTAMAFLCLAEHLSGPLAEQQFKLHVLGIYNQIDRLQLILIDKLFTHFLKSLGLPTPEITHDTINYVVSAMYSSRQLKTYSFDGANIHQYRNIIDVPDSIVREVYFDDELYNGFIYERERQKSFDEFDDISFVVPLNVHSHMQLDSFLEYVAEQYNFCNLIVDEQNIHNFENIANSICYHIQKAHSDIFSIGQMENLKNNLVSAHNCWRLLQDGDIEGIRSNVKHYIRLLGLSDPFEN